MKAQPFVKWVGGKRQLLPEIRKYYPQALTNNNVSAKIDTYIEPFVGGGAVFFDIINTCPKNNKPKTIVINDSNETLILTYKMIQKKVNDVIAILSKLEKQYYYMKKIDEYQKKDNTKTYYKEIRDKYNHAALSDTEKAAYFIFLNRTCFNGLYRLNKNGEFNVPMGKQSRPTLCDIPNLKAVNKALKGVTITSTDYTTCIDKYLTPNSFIYIDPPYRPLNDTSGFTAYTTNKFSDEDQKNLAKTINTINACGAKFLLSNSDPHNNDPKDDFFDDLYKDYTIERIMAARAINSKGSGRGKITELLIHN